jgi:hypothetical protein
MHSMAPWEGGQLTTSALTLPPICTCHAPPQGRGNHGENNEGGLSAWTVEAWGAWRAQHGCVCRAYGARSHIWRASGPHARSWGIWGGGERKNCSWRPHRAIAAVRRPERCPLKLETQRAWPREHRGHQGDHPSMEGRVGTVPKSASTTACDGHAAGQSCHPLPVY